MGLTQEHQTVKRDSWDDDGVDCDVVTGWCWVPTCLFLHRWPTTTLGDAAATSSRSPLRKSADRTISIRGGEVRLNLPRFPRLTADEWRVCFVSVSLDYYFFFNPNKCVWVSTFRTFGSTQDKLKVTVHPGQGLGHARDQRGGAKPSCLPRWNWTSNGEQIQSEIKWKGLKSKTKVMDGMVRWTADFSANATRCPFCEARMMMCC